MAVFDCTQRLNFPHRVASLMRFREKRKERNFDKKIRYTVRKEVALRFVPAIWLYIHNNLSNVIKFVLPILSKPYYLEQLKTILRTGCFVDHAVSKVGMLLDNFT
jgi:hypothetical protein